MRARANSILLGAMFLLGSVAQAVPLQGYDPERDYERGANSKAMQYAREGMRFQKSGDINNAIEAYRKSEGFSPNIKEVHYYLGQCLAAAGMNDDAMGEFRQALNIDGNWVECRNDYGMFLQHRLNKVEQAEREYKKCMQIEPKYPFPYYNYALILREKGDLEGAIDNFQTTVRLKPDFSEAWRDLGLAIFERASSGDLLQALDALEKAEKLVPNNPKIHYHLGIIYATKGDLDRAEAEQRKALMCDARMAAAHWELARLRYLRGDLDRCMLEIKEAEKINPTYTKQKKYADVSVKDMKTLTAKCIEFKHQLPQAIEAYQELSRIAGSDALYGQHILDLQKTIKLEIKARKKKPITYDPEEVDAFVKKGLDLVEDGQLDSAKSAFDRALEINPNSFEALMGLTGVLENQGDLNGAVAANQKANIVNPMCDGAYYNLAYLLEKMSLLNDAGMMYKKFHDLSGKYPYDPQHIIDLQQDIIRQEKIEQNKKMRGY